MIPVHLFTIYIFGKIMLNVLSAVYSVNRNKNITRMHFK